MPGRKKLLKPETGRSFCGERIEYAKLKEEDKKSAVHAARERDARSGTTSTLKAGDVSQGHECELARASVHDRARSKAALGGKEAPMAEEMSQEIGSELARAMGLALREGPWRTVEMDLSKYFVHLEGLGLSEDEMLVLIKEMVRYGTIFVDCGFDVSMSLSPCGKHEKNGSKSGAGRKDVVGSEPSTFEPDV